MYILFLLQCNSNKSIFKLKMSKVINSYLLYEDIEKYYLKHKACPYCLIQLSNKEYHDLCDNSINVTGIQYKISK